MSTPIPELTDRMRQVFGLVVEAYLERGIPVGSKMLAPSISLSPASIRGVMQELEERGLLTHPHTSAGRMPTESGLRLFVDGMMQASLPGAAERAAIEAERAAWSMERSQLLKERDELRVVVNDPAFTVAPSMSDGKLVDAAMSWDGDAENLAVEALVALTTVALTDSVRGSFISSFSILPGSEAGKLGEAALRMRLMRLSP